MKKYVIATYDHFDNEIKIFQCAGNNPIEAINNAPIEARKHIDINEITMEDSIDSINEILGEYAFTVDGAFMIQEIQ